MRYWLDCEFDGWMGRLLSLALVSEQNDEFYWCADAPQRHEITDGWVWENVVPIMRIGGAQPNRKNLASSLEVFLLGNDTAHIIVDWPDDVAYFCRAMITGPGRRINTPPLTFEVTRHDAYPTDLENAVQHNALWDARALRHLMEPTQ